MRRKYANKVVPILVAIMLVLTMFMVSQKSAYAESWAHVGLNVRTYNYTGSTVKLDYFEDWGYQITGVSFYDRDKEQLTGNNGKDIPIDSGNYRASINYKYWVLFGYKTGSTTEYFSIEKLDSMISITSALDMIYSGNLYDKAEYSVSGSNGQVIMQYQKDNGNGLYEDISSAPSEVGNYKVTATVVESTNYKSAVSSAAEFRITKADTFVEEVNAESKFVDGTPVDVKWKINSFDDYDVAAITYEKKNSEGTFETIDYVPVEAGQYRVTVKVVADKNHNSSSNACEFEIKKYDNEIALNNQTYIYSGNPVELDYTSAVEPSIVNYFKAETNGTYTSLDGAPTTVGNYRVNIIAPTNATYKSANKQFDFQIIAAANTTPVVNPTLARPTVNIVANQVLLGDTATVTPNDDATNIQDDKTPLASKPSKTEEKTSGFNYMALCAGLIALALLLLLLFKRRKKNEEE